jgi:hypothetical protein
MIPKYKRNEIKLYLDKEETEESAVNRFIECRDGIVKMYEYHDCGGYGGKTRLFHCEDTKHEVVAIIRQNWDGEQWREEVMYFDTDSYKFLDGLINNDETILGGKFELLRDY